MRPLGASWYWLVVCGHCCASCAEQQSSLHFASSAMLGMLSRQCSTGAAGQPMQEGHCRWVRTFAALATILALLAARPPLIIVTTSTKHVILLPQLHELAIVILNEVAYVHRRQAASAFLPLRSPTLGPPPAISEDRAWCRDSALAQPATHLLQFSV